MDDIWRSLFSQRVFASGGAIADLQTPLAAQEEPLAVSMRPVRRAEFTAGRTLARRALAALGLPPGPLLRDRAGAVVWPPGAVGSITHVRDGAIAFCAAAVSTDPSLLGIGLDAEPAAPLPSGVRTMVLTQREREMLATLPADIASWAERLIFSAKESVYKCLYPSSGRFLEFHDVEVRLRLDEGAFSACIRGTGDSEIRIGTLQGRFANHDGLLLTALELDRDHIPGGPV